MRKLVLDALTNSGQASVSRLPFPFLLLSIQCDVLCCWASLIITSGKRWARNSPSLRAVQRLIPEPGKKVLQAEVCKSLGLQAQSGVQGQGKALRTAENRLLQMISPEGQEQGWQEAELQGETYQNPPTNTHAIHSPLHPDRYRVHRQQDPVHLWTFLVKLRDRDPNFFPSLLPKYFLPSPSPDNKHKFTHSTAWRGSGYHVSLSFPF